MTIGFKQLRFIARPPWMVVELFLVLAILTILLGQGTHFYSVQLNQAKMAKVTPYASQARAIVEYYWNLHGRFPKDLLIALQQPELASFRNFMLFNKANLADSNTPDFDFEYHGDGSFSFIPLWPDKLLQNRKVTYQPVIRSAGGGHKLLWGCGYMHWPKGYSPVGVNHTNIDSQFINKLCQPFSREFNQ